MYRCLSFFFWPLCCLSFDLYTDSDYPFSIFNLFLIHLMLRIIFIHYFSCIPRKININIKHILIKHYKIATIFVCFEYESSSDHTVDCTLYHRDHCWFNITTHSDISCHTSAKNRLHPFTAEHVAAVLLSDNQENCSIPYISTLFFHVIIPLKLDRIGFES